MEEFILLSTCSLTHTCPERLAVLVHSINLGYHNQGKNTSILAIKSSYMDCIIRNTTETEVQLNSTNREDGFCTRVIEASHLPPERTQQEDSSEE
jgi:hypothetical protein